MPEKLLELSPWKLWCSSSSMGWLRNKENRAVLTIEIMNLGEAYRSNILKYFCPTTDQCHTTGTSGPEAAQEPSRVMDRQMIIQRRVRFVLGCVWHSEGNFGQAVCTKYRIGRKERPLISVIECFVSRVLGEPREKWAPEAFTGSRWQLSFWDPATLGWEWIWDQICI